MSYYITEECISCGACEPECPNSAISEGSNIFVIKHERCTECVGSFKESQCAKVCPVEACKPDPGHQETKELLLKKWQGLHPNEKPVKDTF